MRVFHSLVFDENIEATGSNYIDASWNAQLGLPDKLTIVAMADTVAGTSPTLTVQIEESPDQVHWTNKSGTLAAPAGTPEINTVTIPTSGSVPLVARDAGTVPNAAYVRLRVSLGGTSPKAHIRIWVTGRGEQIP